MSRPIDIAWRLDRLRWIPLGVLTDVVDIDGRCMTPEPHDEPDWHDVAMTDRELATRMCAGCPVRDECLELELRTAGEHTIGVWGGLSENDRHALLPLWRGRGDRSVDGDV